MPLGLVIAVAASFALRGSKPTTPIDYTTFYSALDDGEVKAVVMRGDELEGELSKPRTVDGKQVTHFQTQLPTRDDPALLPLLRAKGVVVRVEAASGWTQLLVGLLPWVLILGVWFFISKRLRGAAGGQGTLAALLGKHNKRFEQEDAVDVRFDDVAGLDGAKRDLGEIVDFLRNPESFARLGGKLPRGALLVGAPGTGKTLLARAVAGEAGVPFFSISGSEFIELFVGVGAARVRELFEAAKKAPHAIIFIDEIDAVGRSRGTGLGGGHDEREQTLNQLLAAMDGFDRTDRVVVLAATNRPDVLDSALLRPGRFDRRILVDLPACAAREAILKVHSRPTPLAQDVVLADVAAATTGFSGAELANLVNEATLRAVRRGADQVTAGDFDLAHDKILLGEPRDAHLTADEKQRVAVHEAGHAVVAHLLEPSSPLRRVSIIPRGNALGATQQLLRADSHLHTRSELSAKLAVLLGGYAAEKLVLGEVSTGAENDLRQASSIAQRMVGQLGMSEALGPVFHEHRSEHPFLGARIATDSGVSDATIYAIEQETQLLLSTAEAAANATLNGQRRPLDQLVAALLEHETLDHDEVLASLSTAPTAAVLAPSEPTKQVRTFDVGDPHL
ncbi:MAG: ATP-dependent zinc metalloprotease FtsH [Deltaproteobacteria bacterium]|nr:ATP-dependent zinc metalloprotease FtsH [Deltaproteobacteria bacterium]MBW2532518.1 ATP-dependent zinc metalloprotease FtsH [Deltaproteobacteria bacterium]